MGRRRSFHLSGREHAAPIPIASVIGNILFSSGIGPNDPDTRDTPEDPAEQARVMFNNIRAVMEAAGGSPDDIIHVHLTLRDRKLREHIDPEWLKMFPDEDARPARHAVQADGTGASLMQCQIIAVME